MFAEVVVGGVGSAILDGLSVGQIAIGALSRGCTGENSHLELSSCLMLGKSDFGKFLGYGLCHTGWCEATKSEMFTILDQ